MKTGKTLKSNPGAEVAVFVDNRAAEENVTKFAESRGYSVASERVPDGIRLLLRPSGR